MIWIATFLSTLMAAVGAGLFTGLARRGALRAGVLDEVNYRSSHTVPTPRLGGIGLGLGFALGAACLAFLQLRGTLDTRQMIWLAAVWGGMFLIGLADDLKNLPPLVKLGAMIVVAVPAAWVAGGAQGWAVFGFSAAGQGAQALTAADAVQAAGAAGLAGGALVFVFALGWILFFTNAYNFMDGMDGFAGTFALQTCVWVFGAAVAGAWRSGTMLPWDVFFLPVLAGACAGFLKWNWPPARIFMGDAGSLSVGLVLALLPLRAGAWGLHGPWGVWIVLLPFIFDAVLTLVRRGRRGENVLKAHREHLYQRLMQTGLPHARVLRMNLWRMGLCGAAGAVASVAPGRWTPALAAAVALGCMLQYWALTLRREAQTQTGRQS